MRKPIVPKIRRVAAMQHGCEMALGAAFVVTCAFTLLRAIQDRALSIVAGNAVGPLNLDSEKTRRTAAAIWIRDGKVSAGKARTGTNRG